RSRTPRPSRSRPPRSRSRRWSGGCGALFLLARRVRASVSCCHPMTRAKDRMIETRFTQLVGATVPIQVASMPGVSTIELVAAVANAGAVGMLGASMFSAEQLDAELARVATATSGVFGVNFLMPFLDPKCVAVAARRARI